MGQVHLARVDERLVHGQVMTNLSKSAGANSIFIVDDEVAKDDFMKMIFVNSGSRTGLTVKVLGVDECIKYWNEKEFEKFSVILLVKTIDTADRLVKGGVPFKQLNIGGLAKKDHTTYIINQVAISKEQAAVLQNMRDDYGIKVYFQSVPSSQRVELEDALKQF